MVPVKQSLRRYTPLYTMFLPTFICLILFHYLPIWGVAISFLDYSPWNGFFKSKWVGLENFRFVFSISDFPRLIRNTIVLSFYKIVFGFPSAILFALMLNEVKVKRLKSMYQTVSYMPYFISWIVVSGLLYNLLGVNFGALNNIRKTLGMAPVQWYGQVNLWRTILTSTYIWKMVGYNSILYLAAISQIDSTLYEAAAVDGANRIRQTLHITLPGLVPTTTILLIMSIGSIMQSDFGQLYALVGNNIVLYEKVDTLDFYIYRVGFQAGRYSVGAAMNLFQSLIGLTLVLISNYFIRRVDGEALW